MCNLCLVLALAQWSFCSVIALCSSTDHHWHVPCVLFSCRPQVLSNPMHNWDHVPEAFCRQLRQPLCMALLRNCATPDSAAYSLALKLLMAILNLPRMRHGLRAELGAFYPLLVLRYLEQQQACLASTALQPQQQQQVQAPDPANVAAALSALQGLLADPQLLVDLYVNFDCDLQAANLFERTVQVRGCVLVAVAAEGMEFLLHKQDCCLFVPIRWAPCFKDVVVCSCSRLLEVTSVTSTMTVH